MYRVWCVKMASIIPADLASQAQSASKQDIQNKLAEVNALSNHLNMIMQQKNGAQQQSQNLDQMYAAIKKNLDDESATLQKMIDDNRKKIAEKEREISSREGQIRTKEEIIEEHRQSVEDQKALLQVRDRMLQLSQEKNIYKQKVIYALLTLIIAVFLIMIVGYVYFGGAGAAANAVMNAAVNTVNAAVNTRTT